MCRQETDLARPRDARPGGGGVGWGGFTLFSTASFRNNVGLMHGHTIVTMHVYIWSCTETSNEVDKKKKVEISKLVFISKLNGQH